MPLPTMSPEIKDILQTASWIAGSLGLLTAGLSAFLSFRVLIRNVVSFRADHDRSRRAEALKLLLIWNDNVLTHRRAIEKQFHGILDNDGGISDKVYLTEEHATKIYLAKLENVDDWELRFHIIELINFLEAISVAYIWGIADRELIEFSFKPTILNYSKALQHFVAVVIACRGHDPWKPYTELLELWKPATARLRRLPDESEKAAQREVVTHALRTIS
jgi:hypothetical protein